MADSFQRAPNEVKDEESPAKVDNKLVVDDRDDDFKAPVSAKLEDHPSSTPKHGGHQQ